MFWKILALFTVVPIVELYLLIKIGGQIGALATVGIVIGTGVAGAALARQQGARVWHQMQQEMEAGRFPADRLIDALLLLVAGALLITPGLLTDLSGLLVLIPVTRKPIREWVKRRLARMMQDGDLGIGGFIR
jgi:UPF0716 protein FxsA